MSSLKRWKQVGQGQFLRWDTPGQEVEGVWQGPHDGQFGPLGTVETPDGRMRWTFPLPIVLFDRLKLVHVGTHVLIRYTGHQTAKSGRLFKGFEVFLAGDDGLMEPGNARWSRHNAEDASCPP